MILPLFVVLLTHQRPVWCHGVGQLFRYLKSAVIHTSAACRAIYADIASEPEAWLLASFVQLNGQVAQRAFHPFAAMSLLMKVKASASIKQLTHRNTEECCVLLQCLVALV